MVRRRFCMLSFAILALMGARPCLADPLTLTGNVTADFDLTNPDVQKSPSSIYPLLVGSNVSGWGVQNIWSYYDPKTDTMQVGLETFKNGQGQPAIFGDADGNGDPGTISDALAKQGGIDTAHLGGKEAFAVAFSATKPTNEATDSGAALIAGVPKDKSLGGSGIDGFTISQFHAVNGGLYNKFGTTLGASAGSLAFDPSAAHPQAEFTINNFSKLAGIDPTVSGLWIRAYAGTNGDIVVGEFNSGWIKLPAFAAETPEPATWLAWSAVVAAGAVVRRRRNRAAVRPV